MLLTTTPEIELDLNAAETPLAANVLGLLAATGDVVVQLSSVGKIIAIQGKALFEEMSEALIGSPFRTLASSSSSSTLQTMLEEVMDTGNGAVAHIQLNQLCRIKWAEIRLSPISGINSGFIGIIRDESVVVENETKLQHALNHDVLTELPNRAMFLEQVGHNIEVREPFALLTLDIAGFKQVNASLGFKAGDALLKAVALRVASALRTGDILTRWGCNELVILVEGADTEVAVQRLSQRIFSALFSPFKHNNQTVHLNVSGGAALFPRDGTDVETLISSLDNALTLSKQTGFGKCLFAESKATNLSGYVELDASMYQAVQRGEFHLEYQPLVDAKSRRIKGFEALMRWTTSEGKRISPAEFIPVAERNGLINLLGSWALKVACTDILKLQEVLGHSVYVSVNVSPTQFNDDKLNSHVSAAITSSGIESSQLLLEITEGALMANPTRSGEILQQWASMGIKIAVDDFGTGYSSLAYLKNFPVSILKIDRAFIKDLPDSKKDEGICRAVITLANYLNLTTVAEGVETQEQLDLMASLGCNTIQGYFTGRPTSLSQLLQQLSV